MRSWLIIAVVLTLTSAVRAQTPELDPEHAAKMAKGLDLFKKQVRPVLVAKCLKCHGGKSVENEFDLADRATLLKGGLAGVAVIPGKAKDSLLIKLLNHTKEPHMPQGSPKLPDADIARIAEWINLGAPYDAPLATTRAKAIAWTEKVLPAEAKKFWSLQPLQKVAAPLVNQEAWVRTPIDRFILAQLEAKNLKPNLLAGKQALLRRLYFDLIGLPPAPDEVEAFEKAASRDPQAAVNEVIDRLLQSQHFGERWARHWLDLARFAESHGFEHDYDRPTAYHFRDFVIEAFNQDLPFDTFVKWQIAGDELAPGNPLALKATGFLAAGVHSTQITKNEVEKHRYDELDDKLSTMTTAMLGLSVGCARCHDHKYDPIPQRDYYRMLAAFTATVRSEVDLNLDPEGHKKALAEFAKAHAPLVQAVKDYEERELSGKFAAWEKAGKTPSLRWETLEPLESKSKDGATLTLQPDGSILATGKKGAQDVYTFMADSYSKDIRYLRLEALSHPSLVKGGPGRAGNGNFALSNVQLGVAPLKKPGQVQTIGLKNARATFEQKGLPIAAAIDKDLKSAWAIDPQFGKDQAAVFELEQPISLDEGARLTIVLSFNNNAEHSLGRLRLGLASGQDAPELTTPGLSGKVRHALAVPAEQRNGEQKTALLHWFKTTDPGWRDLNQKVQANLTKQPKAKTVKALVATEGLPAVRLHTQGEDLLPATHFLRRGDVAQKEGVAAPGYLQVLMPEANAAKRWQVTPPAGAKQTFQRAALANWMTDVDQGAGQLLARVIVNRLWQHYMGRGLVATPSDFGVRGERPTHPELLDYLAAELIKGGWKLRPIHKLILSSAVYQQNSAFDEDRAKIDRDNKLLWRKPARRLEAEIIRDNLLAVGGELDRTQFGPGTLKEDSKRRSIYFTVKRSKLMPMMVIFDAPEALTSMADRPTTTIAPQALHLLNNAQVRQTARGFATRLQQDAKTDLEKAVRQAYRIALARLPDQGELGEAVQFIQQQEATYPGPTARSAALTDFCQVLLCLNEFVYVD